MTTYYVDPVSGSDGNAGTSFGAAFATTQFAIDSATTAGDEIRLCNTGTETITTMIDVDGVASTEGNRTVVSSYNATGTAQEDGYTIQASAAITAVLKFAPTYDYYDFVGVTADGNSNATNAWYSDTDSVEGTRLIRCRGTGATNGFQLRNSVWVLIECEADNNTNDGMRAQGANRGTFKLYGCRIHDNGGEGLYVQQNGWVIVGCSIYDNTGLGIEIRAAYGDGSAIEFNTIYGNGSDGIETGGSGSTGITIHGNSICNNGRYGMNTTSSNIHYFVGNHYYGNTTDEWDVGDSPEPGKVTGDPLFVSVVDGSEDFTPGSGSPLIGAGFSGGNIGAVAHASGGGNVIVIED